MLIQQESKKNLDTKESREKKGKTKGMLVKKGICKNRTREDKTKRKERRRAHAEQQTKTEFRLSQKFQTRSPADAENGSHEPLGTRIQKAIESVNGTIFPDEGGQSKETQEPSQGIRIEDLEKDGIITPKVLTRFGHPRWTLDPNEEPAQVENDEEERNRILEEEIEKTGIIDQLLAKQVGGLANIFREIHEMGDASESGGDEQHKDALEVVPEDEESELREWESERERDPIWMLKKKVKANVNRRMDKVNRKKNSQEYQMEKLKRDGKDYLFRKGKRAAQPEAQTVEGAPNPRNQPDLLPESARDQKEHQGFNVRGRGSRLQAAFFGTPTRRERLGRVV